MTIGVSLAGLYTICLISPSKHLRFYRTMWIAEGGSGDTASARSTAIGNWEVFKIHY